MLNHVQGRIRTPRKPARPPQHRDREILQTHCAQPSAELLLASPSMALNWKGFDPSWKL